MIIPTAEFDPLFADDGVPFRAKMTRYIQTEFADLLGNRQHLLATDQGLDQLTASLEANLSNNAARNAA